MPDTGEARPGGTPVGRIVLRLAMTALILLLGWRTYQETAVALARSGGSLRTAHATVTELTPRTKHASTGGGQDGGGYEYTHTEYTVELRLPEGLKTAHGVGGAARQLWNGKQVDVGLWHGRVVEIDGRDVWPGWHRGATDIALIVLYPLIMAYLIALAVSARSFVAGRTGRVRLEWGDRFEASAPGFLVGVAGIFLLIVCGTFGHAPAFWPVLPVGAGVTVALTKLNGTIRRAGTRPRRGHARCRRRTGTALMEEAQDQVSPGR